MTDLLLTSSWQGTKCSRMRPTTIHPPNRDHEVFVRWSTWQYHQSTPDSNDCSRNNVGPKEQQDGMCSQYTPATNQYRCLVLETRELRPRCLGSELDRVPLQRRMVFRQKGTAPNPVPAANHRIDTLRFRYNGIPRLWKPVMGIVRPRNIILGSKRDWRVLPY